MGFWSPNRSRGPAVCCALIASASCRLHPEFQGSITRPRSRGDRCTTTGNNRRLPSLPRDEVPRYHSSQGGRGSHRRRVFLESLPGFPPRSSRSVPSCTPIQGTGGRRHHGEPVSRPTCHYVMGGLRSSRTPRQPRCAGCSRRRGRGGMHGSNRLAQLAVDLLVSVAGGIGRRLRGFPGARPLGPDRRRAAPGGPLRPLRRCSRSVPRILTLCIRVPNLTIWSHHPRGL